MHQRHHLARRTFWDTAKLDAAIHTLPPASTQNANCLIRVISCELLPRIAPVSSTSACSQLRQRNEGARWG